MSRQGTGTGFLPGAIFGIVLTAGFWFGPDAFRLFMQFHEPVLPPPPVTGEPAVPAMPPDKTVAPEPPAAEPSRAVPSEDTAAALASLQRTCAFWSARASDSAGRLYRDRACRQMREYAGQHGQRTPVISTAPPPSATESAPRRQPAAPRAVINECTRHERGTISYRKCRAMESQRLKNLCQVYRQRDEWQLAGEWCAAYERYPIVD